MSLEFNRSKLKLKVYGEEYELLFPTVKQSQDFAKEVKEVEGDDDKSSKMFDFLEKLGLPKNVTEEMEVQHLEMVLEKLMPSKKK